MDIQNILTDHKLWLADNTKGKRANLSYANLRGADLRGANLRGANLRGANLIGANFSGAIGNTRELKSGHFEAYEFIYSHNILQIGCENHPIAEWWEFDDKRILQMGGKKALVWWRKWKPVLHQIIAVSPAVKP